MAQTHVVIKRRITAGMPSHVSRFLFFPRKRTSLAPAVQAFQATEDQFQDPDAVSANAKVPGGVSPVKHVCKIALPYGRLRSSEINLSMFGHILRVPHTHRGNGFVFAKALRVQGRVMCFEETGSTLCHDYHVVVMMMRTGKGGRLYGDTHLTCVVV